MSNKQTKNSAPRTIDLTVKPTGKKEQSFVTPGMMYNKA